MANKKVMIDDDDEDFDDEFEEEDDEEEDKKEKPKKMPEKEYVAVPRAVSSEEMFNIIYEQLSKILSILEERK